MSKGGSEGEGYHHAVLVRRVKKKQTKRASFFTLTHSLLFVTNNCLTIVACMVERLFR